MYLNSLQWPWSLSLNSSKSVYFTDHFKRILQKLRIIWTSPSIDLQSIPVYHLLLPGSKQNRSPSTPPCTPIQGLPLTHPSKRYRNNPACPVRFPGRLRVPWSPAFRRIWAHSSLPSACQSMYPECQFSNHDWTNPDHDLLYLASVSLWKAAVRGLGSEEN